MRAGDIPGQAVVESPGDVTGVHTSQGLDIAEGLNDLSCGR
eukprot:CAMPEP_0180509854 /NCGR_PEP_ID=MMETSP1036_2-20121128/49953_1 /TAXON_ID=632150 /ORGANISM="Azadinium spinosum, Strain 3D9" /LENGTH=40 /DNA_ID= /DNA_START= /DNA_END= /DNA_ORIENTATION=